MNRTKSDRVIHATDRKATRLNNKNTCRILARIPDMYDETIFEVDRTEQLGWS